MFGAEALGRLPQLLTLRPRNFTMAGEAVHDERAEGVHPAVDYSLLADVVLLRFRQHSAQKAVVSWVRGPAGDAEP